MATDLLFLTVLAHSRDIKTSCLQAAGIPCVDGSIQLDASVAFVRSASLAREKVSAALLNFLPRRIVYETFLVVAPRFSNTDIAAVHDEILRIILRLSNYNLMITGYVFTDNNGTGTTFRKESFGSLNRNTMTRGVAEDVVKSIRRFVAGRTETYSLEFMLTLPYSEEFHMWVYLLSPFVGKKLDGDSVEIPGWLPIFCDYGPSRGVSEHNTVVLQYTSASERKARLANYCACMPASHTQAELQTYLVSLVDLQDMGAKTLTVVPLVSPELYSLESLKRVLRSVCKDALFLSSAATSAADTRPGIPKSVETAVGARDDSVEDSSMLVLTNLNPEPSDKEVIRRLEAKIEAMSADQFTLGKLIAKEQSLRTSLEDRVSELIQELTLACDEARRAKRKVAHLLRCIQEGNLQLEELEERLASANDSGSAGREHQGSGKAQAMDQDNITLDDFLFTLPIGGNGLAETIPWEHIAHEMDHLRCSTGLQSKRKLAEQGQGAPSASEEEKELDLDVLNYKNKILELEQRLVESDIQLHKIREEVQDEYEERLQSEISRVKAEAEREFEERLRSLNPKAWYDYVERGYAEERKSAENK